MREPDKHGNQHPDQQQQQQPPPHLYGTFQGVGVHNYPPQPVTGFPQPAPPPVAPGGPPANPYDHVHHHHQAVPVPGYGVAQGRPVGEHRLPCCGIGIGWFLFIIGFFLAAIPWYVGTFILLCARYDAREKPGYVACLIAAIIGTIAVIFGVTR